MDDGLWRIFLATFTSVFVAELGDKTQLATMALSGGASGAKARMVVFVGASLALVATSALGVLAGGVVGRFLSPGALHKIAGVLFVVLGVWMFVSKS
jgi:putative Ca2+/H+ antiporter (TMEM165/GDT1 family)